MCVYLTGVYLMGVHFTGMHLIGVCLISVHSTGVSPRHPPRARGHPNSHPNSLARDKLTLIAGSNSAMGNIFSSNPKSRLGICLTLDAFGTLYHPKRPIAVQYLEVSRRCGLKANIQVPELEASFRKAFK